MEINVRESSISFSKTKGTEKNVVKTEFLTQSKLSLQSCAFPYPVRFHCPILLRGRGQDGQTLPVFPPIDILGAVVVIDIEAHFDISRFQQLRVSEFHCQEQTLKRMKGFHYCQVAILFRTCCLWRMTGLLFPVPCKLKERGLWCLPHYLNFAS